MSFIKIPMKGMRDILPEEMEIRDFVINKICEVYRQYGFKKVETPCIEHIENIENNQGGENSKLIFKILKRGEKLDLEGGLENISDCGLRYDLTVPLSRYYSNNMNNLDNPFKALQIGNVWRAERPQKGRFRQFVQCDIDIFGEKNNLAEVELISATSKFLKVIGLEKFKIVINDRRILKAMALNAGFANDECNSVFISLDKMDKIGIDGVRSELIEKKYDINVVNNYLNLFDNNSNNVESFCSQISEKYLSKEIINNLIEIIDISRNTNFVNIEFDPTLVRGMSYYTGPIFEIKVEGYPGSIGGGGRYDEMVEKYANISVPACGFSIGFERLISILLENKFVIPNEAKKYAIVIDKNSPFEIITESLEKANELRNKGNIVNVLFKSKNFKYQISTLENNGYEIIIK